MLDPFDRRIDYLRVSVTDRCNLRCVYCAPGRQRLAPSELLTTPEITRLVRSALGHGLRKVRLTGGEPLLREDIVELVGSIKSLGVKDLSMTTNGLLLPGAAQSLKKAGLDRVNISLDTLDPKRFKAMTGGHAIETVWEAIESAKEAGLSPVKINMVPLRGINGDEIPAFASLTYANDFHIRFIEYMPIGKKTLPEDARITKKEMMDEIAALGGLRRLPFRGGGPSRNYRLSGAKGIIGFISPVTDHFCRYCNRLRLTSTGRLRPCLLNDKEIDVLTPLRAGISDAALEALVLDAVRAKPARGATVPFPSLLKSRMSLIGG